MLLWIFVIAILWLIICRRIIWRGVYLGLQDTIFLSSDEFNTTIIHAILALKDPLPRERLISLVETRFLKFKEFNRKVVKRKWGWYYWKDVKVNLSDHMSFVSLPGAADHKELEQFCSNKLTTAFNLARPLWEIYYIDNYKTTTGASCVLLFRIHHCLGDGIGLMKLALSLFNNPHDMNSDASPPASPPASPLKHPQSPTSPTSPTSQPPPIPPTLGEKLQLGAAAALKLLVMPHDPVSTLKNATPMKKTTPINVRWNETPLDLAKLKVLAKKLSVSVNDVLFAATAGALRFYLLKRHPTVQRVDVQSALWVSLRGTSLDGPIKLGNKIGAVYLKLPIKTDSPVERVKDVKRQTDLMRKSPEPLIARVLMQIFGFLPPIIAFPLWNAVAYKVSASVSNVPGPQFPLEFAGSEIESMQFFVAPARNIANFLCVLSYNGKVYFGLACDSRIIEEPREVIGYFEQELNELDRALTSDSKESPLKETTSASNEEPKSVLNESKSVLNEVKIIPKEAKEKKLETYNPDATHPASLGTIKENYNVEVNHPGSIQEVASPLDQESNQTQKSKTKEYNPETIHPASLETLRTPYDANTNHPGSIQQESVTSEITTSS